MSFMQKFLIKTETLLQNFASKTVKADPNLHLDYEKTSN